MMEPLDPTKKFQINGQVYELKSAWTNAGVGANQLFIPAVTGKKLLFLGLMCQSLGTLGGIRYTDSVTTSALTMIIQPPRDNGPFVLPVGNGDAILFQTAVGSGLDLTIDTAPVYTQVWYLEVG